MLEVAFVLLALLNVVLLVVIATRPADEVAGSKKYNIVGLRGEVLQGPLSLKKAMRAQKKWDDSFVFDGGPRTIIELVRKNKSSNRYFL